MQNALSYLIMGKHKERPLMIFYIDYTNNQLEQQDQFIIIFRGVFKIPYTCVHIIILV